MVDVPKKVEIYEQFLNEKLKNDLKSVFKERDQMYAELNEYLQVKNTIENIIKQILPSKNDNENIELKTKVDLGCNFYVNAVVPNANRIFIAIGYGFYLEMTFDEALRFIEKKSKSINETINELNKQASLIKANIKLVLEGIKEIQNLEFDNETPYYEP